MEKLYRKKVYLKEARANILSVKPVPGNPQDAYIILDKSLFFPEGGGQSADHGFINEFEVLDVHEKDRELIHLVKNAFGKFEPGDEVRLVLDWEHRFDNMQRHLGEHILSGAFYSLFGAVNRGFHMGKDYMTIDLALPENSPHDRITDEMGKAAEIRSNEIIWQDLPVTVSHFESRSQAETMPVRKNLTLEKDISIVTVGSIDHPADCVACCGTHPSSSGQVGLIKIYKIESNKDMFRIYFDAGKRAFLDCQKRYENLSLIENDLSAGADDFKEKYAIKKRKDEERHEKLSALTRHVVSTETESLRRAIETNRDSAALVRSYELLSPDDLTAMGRSLAELVRGFLFLIHLPSNTLMLFSSDKDCGKLIKSTAKNFNGRGGGSKNFARAVFPDKGDIDAFIRSLVNKPA